MHHQHHALLLNLSTLNDMRLIRQPIRRARRVDPLRLDAGPALARGAQADVVPEDARLRVRDGGRERGAACEDAARVVRAEGEVPAALLVLAAEDRREALRVRPRAGDDVRRVAEGLCACEVVGGGEISKDRRWIVVG